jgi:Zn finger protein HypA/HybF involved in hydrogenase expression
VNLTKRRAFQCHVIDTINELAALSPLNAPTCTITCPRCRVSWPVPADSDRVRVDCPVCGAELVTRLVVDCVTVVQLGGSA